MKLLEDITLQNSIEIKTTPENIFDFFIHLEQNYQMWHPEDHIALRWLKGKPFEEGSVVYYEEYLHGKVHKGKFIVSKVVPKREIEFCPVFWLWRIYFPKNTFIIEPKGEKCIFTATVSFRVGWFVKTFARKKLEFGIERVTKHIQEEGEYLKRILESKVNSHNNRMDCDKQ